jgi:polysaccharide export outer membrane protein
MKTLQCRSPRGTRRRSVSRTLVSGVLVAWILARPAPAISQTGASDYTVGPRDVLAVTVVNEPGLSGRFNVLEDGTVNFPLLGAVQVAGLPVDTVERVLTTRLSDGFLEKPVVSVAVAEVVSRRFFVLGEVRQAGTFSLGTRTTVLEALLKAGGPTPKAARHVVIIRSASGPVMPGVAESVTRVDLEALQKGDLGQNVLLEDGDLLFVPESEPAVPTYVMGLVNNPGAYQLPVGATVLQALAQAGGVTDRGSTSRIEIVRTVDGKIVELKANLNQTVLPGDTIVVKRRYF